LRRGERRQRGETDVNESVDVSEVTSESEVSGHQIFLEHGLSRGVVLLQSPPQEPMGTDRVGAYCAGEIELDTLIGSSCRHLFKDCGGSFGASELAGIDVAHRCGLSDRSGRVELVGPIDDVDPARIGAVREIPSIGLQTGNGPIEPFLSDVTPRTDDVGPNVDAHGNTVRRQLG